MKHICIFTSSHSDVDEVYIKAAEELGAALGKNGFSMIFGGTNSGLMSITASAVQQHGGQVIAVMLKDTESEGTVYQAADEIVYCSSIRERKRIMEERSDGFICFPGGLGTLDELAEVLTLKQKSYISKPIVILNISGYYNPLLLQFEKAYEEHFIRKSDCELYYVAATVEDALKYLKQLDC